MILIMAVWSPYNLGFNQDQIALIVELTFSFQELFTLILLVCSFYLFDCIKWLDFSNKFSWIQFYEFSELALVDNTR